MQYLQTRAEETISAIAKKANVSDAFKSDIAKFLLSLSPLQRVELITEINSDERLELSYKQDSISRRIEQTNQAEGLLNMMKDDDNEIAY